MSCKECVWQSQFTARKDPAIVQIRNEKEMDSQNLDGFVF